MTITKKSAIVKAFFISVILAGSIGCASVKPPKPGSNFIWVPKQVKVNGIIIPGHWKHIGKVHKNKAWTPGHYNAKGVWIPGKWKLLGNPPKKGKVWIPGHRTPNGRWIKGHWR